MEILCKIGFGFLLIVIDVVYALHVVDAGRQVINLFVNIFGGKWKIPQLVGVISPPSENYLVVVYNDNIISLKNNFAT